MREPLVKRLRIPCFEIGLDECWIDPERKEAADRIEELQSQLAASEARHKAALEAVAKADAVGDYAGTEEMTMRDKLAAVLWRTEAVNTGTPQSVIGNRTPEAFAEESPETRSKWLKYADAIITTLPDMVPGLLWLQNGHHHAGGYGYVIRKQGKRFALTMRNQFDQTFDTLEAAKAAAEAHHREAVAKMAGWV